MGGEEQRKDELRELEQKLRIKLRNLEEGGPPLDLGSYAAGKSDPGDQHREDLDLGIRTREKTSQERRAISRALRQIKEGTYGI